MNAATTAVTNGLGPCVLCLAVLAVREVNTNLWDDSHCLSKSQGRVSSRGLEVSTLPRNPVRDRASEMVASNPVVEKLSVKIAIRLLKWRNGKEKKGAGG